VDLLIGFWVGQPAGEEQTGARTDSGDGGDGDQESGGNEDEQEVGENKERERERERMLITGGIGAAPEKGARPRKTLWLYLPKKESA